jgi:hypothetical protein
MNKEKILNEMAARLDNGQHNSTSNARHQRRLRAALEKQLDASVAKVEELKAKEKSIREVKPTKNSLRVRFKNQVDKVYKLDKQRLRRRTELELKTRKQYSLIRLDSMGVTKPSPREAQLIRLRSLATEPAATPMTSSPKPTVTIPLELPENMEQDELELIINAPSTI